jgi:hypothetical protein
MTIKDLSEMVEEARELLIKDFKLANNNKTPVDRDLLVHVKKLYKEGLEDSILGDLYFDDVDCPSDFHKLVLIVASTK